MPTKIEISHKTIIFTVVFLVLLWFLVQISQIIIWLFIAFILMSALKPTVDYLDNRKLPRVLAVLLIYLCLVSVLIFAGSSIIPPLVNQSLRLGERLPKYLDTLFPFIRSDAQVFTQQLAPVGQNILKVSVGIVNNVVAFFTIFVLTFYLLLERKNLDVYLSTLMGNLAGDNAVAIINKVEERLGAWVRGQLALLLIIGVFTYIGLILLAIPYALPLAIIAGVLEIIPTIGPLLSAVPALIVAFIVSPLHALFTVILYLVIQQMENQIFVPLVMKRAVGLPPLVTIIALLVGVKLAGVAGAVLGVPVVVAVEAVITQYFKIKENQTED